MPYIKQEDRRKFDDAIELIRKNPPTTPGELNYLITCAVIEYCKAKGDTRYSTHVNDVVGALECAKIEWYRRVGAPYEDVCIKKNGDVGQ